MTLKIFVVEEEPEQEISFVPLAGGEEPRADEADMELPGGFTIEDDLKELGELDEAGCALEAISLKIGCEGIDLSTARELEQVAPGFMRKAGGTNAFTHRPSLEGLGEAATAVKDTIAKMVDRVRTMVIDLYTRFKNWLLSKIRTEAGKATAMSEAVNTFLRESRRRNALKFVSALPEDAEAAAKEVAILVDGDSDQFAQALTDQLRGVDKQQEAIEHELDANPTQYRIATGVASVESLLNEDADSRVRQMLDKAVRVADYALKNGYTHDLDHVTEEVQQFVEGLVVSDTPSKELGDGRGVTMEQLYNNLSKAADSFTRYDVVKRVEEMVKTVEAIINNAKNMTVANILSAQSRQPESPESQMVVYARKLAKLYGGIVQLGGGILKLWRVRMESIEGTAGIAKRLMDLVSAFESAVGNAANSLSAEQQQQLFKSLAGKGFTISSTSSAAADQTAE